MISRYVEINVEETTFNLINDMYVDARYPTELGILPEGKPALFQARLFYGMVKQVFSAVNDYLNQE